VRLYRCDHTIRKEDHVMELDGKVVVVTGGASGIGKALCERFGAEGAAAVVVADLDDPGARDVAERLSASGTHARGVRCDVTDERDILALVATTESETGPIDLFCSNAGIAIGGGVEVSNADWERIWAVNVMAHVYAARALVPLMKARGGGYILATASAAGLLTNLGSAPYSVTKHGAVALAEWLSITHAADGIRVSCLCPQGVRTPMLVGGIDAGERSAASVVASGDVIEPEVVADAVVHALAEERFLVLPHPEVATYERHRAGDRDRWLTGMRRLWASV
jgi:NAD(P)-dependent dehydrogenase (short-subunit alcohol dehydrogenase family)